MVYLHRQEGEEAGMTQQGGDKQPVLVTGAAGFIGYHVSRALLDAGTPVVGVDSMNGYYDPKLKEARLRELQGRTGFDFRGQDLADRARTAALFAATRPARVIHMAAQAGVRHSLLDPHAYVDANVVAFLNVLEGCRHNGVEHLLFASSSSVYGANTKMPFSIHDNVDHPVSLYAASKKANELMAHCYSHLYRLPVTGLRFFTVYGPWGRPDMALFIFTKAILEGRPIQVFNEGRMRRDFTYIDDVVAGVLSASERVPVPDPQWDGARPDPGSSNAPFRLYNIGNSQPVDLMHVIATLEAALGRKAQLELLPMQPGDVAETYADVADLERDAGFKPATPIEAGIARFVAWYRGFYGV
jgi:UDP-glucuronate 4-epimerase